ncbi:MAG: hypothetical protein R3358_04330, partial [Woeseiaceae bacterium]|nr:hypothetical protein [Woeseiaceae bacterium]
MTRLFALLPLILLSACATSTTAPLAEDQSPSSNPRETDMGLLWVKTAAEYEAVSRQAYQVATAHLPVFIADTSHSALPG